MTQYMVSLELQDVFVDADGAYTDDAGQLVLYRLMTTEELRRLPRTLLLFSRCKEYLPRVATFAAGVWRSWRVTSEDGPEAPAS